MIYQIDKIKKYAHFFGRTMQNEAGDAEFFNWTCSGFETQFTGKMLRAELLSVPSRVPMTEQEVYDYPWIAVFIDGSDVPNLRIELNEPEKWYTLYQSDTTAAHTIKVIKLSENARGKSGIKAIETDGFIKLSEPTEPAYRLEFVGDSITCGFGNEANDRDKPFKTGEENGWITYEAIAARELGAEYSCVCVSGITVSNGSNKKTLFPFPAMESLYEYTDRLHEMAEGKKSGYQHWDFSQHPVDAICVNLGTNDVNFIKMAIEKAAEEKYFIQKYIAFIKKLRKLNGPKTKICCTLGPLDYYLYDDIKDAVVQYIEQSGDKKVYCFKYGGVNIFEEGFGAIGHPSAKTHIRMAKELNDKLRMLLEE